MNLWKRAVEMQRKNVVPLMSGACMDIVSKSTSRSFIFYQIVANHIVQQRFARNQLKVELLSVGLEKSSVCKLAADNVSGK